MRTGIFIDDTGSPGTKSASRFDSTDRKTWLALILNKEDRTNAEQEMQNCIDFLKDEFGVSEFHFNEIYSARKEFKGVDFKRRIGIFQFFASVFRQMAYPMLIQSFSSDDMLRNRFVVSDKKIKADNFNLSDNKDFALYYLLFRVKVHLLKNDIDIPADFIIDNGRQKPNSFQECKLLGEVLHNRKLLYRSSQDEPLLQLADFAAFCMQKQWWINHNNLNGPREQELLEIMSYANFNVLNAKKMILNKNQDKAKIYDKLLENAYEQNNNLDEIELEEFKKWLNS